MNLVKDEMKMQAKSQAQRGISGAKLAAVRGKARAEVAATKARAKATKARAQGSDAAGSKKAVGAAGAIGAVGAFFLDPQQGARRRNVTRDRVAGVARKTSERLRRRAEHGRTTVEGKVEAARSGTAPERPAPNDQALAERVKSEVFQPEDAPKDSVVISAENGVVYLRGEAPNVRTLKKLAKKTEKVDGVREVENLLHLPNTPAPARY